jgi:hypothetical protein
MSFRQIQFRCSHGTPSDFYPFIRVCIRKDIYRMQDPWKVVAYIMFQFYTNKIEGNLYSTVSFFSGYRNQREILYS